MRYLKLHRVTWVIALATLAGACSDGATGPTGPTEPPAAVGAANLVAVTATTLSGIVGTAVTPPPTVRATNSNGNPMANVRVEFEMFSPGGEITKVSRLTDADGVASAVWTLGRMIGPGHAVAQTAGAPHVVFTATSVAGAPATVVRVGGNNQFGFAATAVGPVSVQVFDSFGNPVAGTSVNFAVTGGGGTIASHLATTDVDGIAASGAWSLGESGRNVVVASAAGVSSEPFTAFALASWTRYVLIRVDGYEVTSDWVTGHIILGADGVFAAETTYRFFDDKPRTYAGSGGFGFSGNDIVVRITEGDWLDWSLYEPRSGELIVRGSITDDIVELDWFQAGPDSMTRWTFQRQP